METSNVSHVLKLIDRSNVVLSGVKKIDNFDDKEFLIETVMGNMVIKGNELEMIKFDSIDGNISIKGNIDSMSYFNNTKDATFLNKLFK